MIKRSNSKISFIRVEKEDFKISPKSMLDWALNLDLLNPQIRNPNCID